MIAPRALGALGIVACAFAATAPAAAEAPPAWLAFGVLAGSTQPDGRFADYQWSVTPHAGWGAQARAGRGAWSAGLRWWQTQSEQTLDATDPDAVARTRTSTLELVGRRRLAAFWGMELAGSADTGWLRLGYHPSRVTVASGGGDVEVELAPVNAWIGGAGFAITRPFAGAWSTTLDVERRFFGMDTAHRQGGAIAYGRDTFGDWSARLELAWATRRR